MDILAFGLPPLDRDKNVASLDADVAREATRRAQPWTAGAMHGEGRQTPPEGTRRSIDALDLFPCASRSSVHDCKVPDVPSPSPTSSRPPPRSALRSPVTSALQWEKGRRQHAASIPRTFGVAASSRSTAAAEPRRGLSAPLKRSPPLARPPTPPLPDDEPAYTLPYAPTSAAAQRMYLRARDSPPPAAPPAVELRRASSTPPVDPTARPPPTVLRRSSAGPDASGHFAPPVAAARQGARRWPEDGEYDATLSPCHREAKRA